MKRILLLPLIAIFFIANFCSQKNKAGTTRCEDEPVYEIIFQKDVMVPMRDGVKLATDIYLPGNNGEIAEGKFPVVLMRTPYNKQGPDQGPDMPVSYVPYGYVVIKQDTRGRGNSEGIWHYMTDDRKDGYDAIEWISKQPWFNGQIGMQGTSYVGCTQHLAAMENSPYLTTIVPRDPAINHGKWGARYGGAFRLRVWYWAMRQSAIGSRQSRDSAMEAELLKQFDNKQHYLLHLPLRKGMTPLRHATEYEDIIIKQMEHGANDEFWRFNNIIDYMDEHKDIPVFMIGGWYDLFSTSTTETYMKWKEMKKSPMYLLMGPWIHGAFSQCNGQVDFGDKANLDHNRMHKLWYDRWLKGTEDGFGKEFPFTDKVQLFVMGTGDGHKTKEGNLYHGGEWRAFSDYPPVEAKHTKFFIHEDGTLTAQPPQVQESSTTYEFDPKNPVPTIGGCTCCSSGIMTDGAWNQWGGEHTWTWPHPIPLSARNDIVVFQTEPLENDTEIIGPVEAKIWASSSTVDTDFTVKLIDVYPSGRDYPVGFDLIMGDGIIRARFRDSDKEEKMMTPGQIYEFNIKLDPCCNVFKKGHRIRVDISSSNFPRFDVNPNSGEPLNNNRRMITAVNTIYHDSEHPSHVVLPLMPEK